MRYVTVAGVQLSVIGVGTWQFGSRDWGYGDGYANHEAAKIIDRALDLGINLIDTAEVYAFGKSERIVGQALGTRRRDAFVATKVFPIAPLPHIVDQQGKASRRRLGIDAIDLYQIHQHNRRVPLRTQAGGLRRLLAGGVVRHIGVSNFSLDLWQAAEEALGSPIVSNQVMYSLLALAPEDDLGPWAAAHDHIIIAHSPLGRGLLSGRYDAAHPPAGGRATNPMFRPDNLLKAGPLLDALREISRTHGALPAQVALAWVIRRPNVVAIPGASSVAQLEQNAAAADLELNDEEDALLTSAARAFHPIWDEPSGSWRVTRKAQYVRSRIRSLR